MSKSALRKAMQEFDAYYAREMAKEIDDIEQPRERRLRVSGFPFCGLRTAYQIMQDATAKKRVRKYGSFYHTSVGTITHEIIQNFVGMGGQVWGAWRCRDKKCGGTRKFSCKHKCPRCSKPMEYVEITVLAFKNVSGHIDCVFKDSDGNFWIVDYKTTSKRTLDHQKTDPTLPYATNVAQIESYVALLELMLKIKVSGWILFYVTRDNILFGRKPCGAIVPEAKKKEILARIEKYDKHYEFVKRLHDIRNLMWLAKHKPCGDRTEYANTMKHYEDCPLLGVCFHKKNLYDALNMMHSEYLEVKNCK